MKIMFKKEQETIYMENDLSLSVIIAAHNEEKYIENCLLSILNSNYPKNLYEVILVDDRSTDLTNEIVNKLKMEFTNLSYIKVIGNETDLPFKKNALTIGIRKSKFEYLCVTDADCLVGKEWLNNIADSFKNNFEVSIGYSPYKKDLSKSNSHLNSFLDYEEYKNSLYSFSAVEVNFPYLCSGRNFAYRKSLFNAVGGFDFINNSVSGDDDLLLQLFKKKNASVNCLLKIYSFVETEYPLSFSHFIRQRIRHFSASSFYPFPIKLFYSVIHLTHITILLLLIINFKIGISFLLFKILFDILLINSNSINFNFKQNIFSQIKNEILLITYYLFFGLLSIPSYFGNKKTINWK